MTSEGEYIFNFAKLMTADKTYAGESILLFIAGAQRLEHSYDPLNHPLLLSVSCQSRLQECLRERADLLQAQEASNRQREEEKVEYKRAREAWDRRRKELEIAIAGLRKELKQNEEKIEEMEWKQKVAYRAKQITMTRSFD